MCTGRRDEVARNKEFKNGAVPNTYSLSDVEHVTSEKKWRETDSDTMFSKGGN